MRVLSSDKMMDGVNVEGGKEHLLQKDGTFLVDEVTGKQMIRSGMFTQVGTNFRQARGFECPSCGRENVIRDSCGGCGWHE